MRAIIAGRLVDRAGLDVGEYWTSEAIADLDTLCISWQDELLSMPKCCFSDWLQLHRLGRLEQVAPEPYIPALDPFDCGMDVE